MPDRSPFSVDVAVLTTQGRELAVLLREAERRKERQARERWFLPWGTPKDDEALDGAAQRIARRTGGQAPAWIEQVGAFGADKRHPSDAALSVAYAALVPAGTEPPAGEGQWFSLDELPAVPPRQRLMIDAAVGAVRQRLDQAPVAFRLLPPVFTLSELQETYELLLGRRLHKASFRRALQAAYLVEPTDEWRSEGRGRPAQLFRYAPKRRRGGRRGLRFEMLG
jgi:8-oxo-dGTP diphosphatase